MRLIDADKLKIDDLCDICNSADCANCFSDKAFEQWIASQPTAYDPKKVVEQLKEASYWTDPTYDEDGYSHDDEIEVIDLSDAIETVKGGTV